MSFGRDGPTGLCHAAPRGFIGFIQETLVHLTPLTVHRLCWVNQCI
jgi:hypothetical protein